MRRQSDMSDIQWQQPVCLLIITHTCRQWQNTHTAVVPATTCCRVSSLACLACLPAACVAADQDPGQCHQ